MDSGLDSLQRALAGLAGGCLFYPSAGGHRELPPRVFRPWIHELLVRRPTYDMDRQYGPPVSGGGCRRRKRPSCWGRSTQLATSRPQTEVLQRRLLKEQIAAVVRMPAKVLEGDSLLGLALAGRHADVRVAVSTMFDLPQG